MPNPGEETRGTSTFQESQVKTFVKLQEKWDEFVKMPPIPGHSAESEEPMRTEPPPCVEKPPWLTSPPDVRTRIPPRRF